MSDTKADAPSDGHESEVRQRSIYATAGAFEGLSAPGTPGDDMPMPDTVAAVAQAMHREAVALYGVLRAIPTDLAAWWLRDALAGRCKIDNGYSPALNDRIRALVAAVVRGTWCAGWAAGERYWLCACPVDAAPLTRVRGVETLRCAECHAYRPAGPPPWDLPSVGRGMDGSLEPLGLDDASAERDWHSALAILRAKGLDPARVIADAAANLAAWSAVPNAVRVAVPQPPDEAPAPADEGSFRDDLSQMPSPGDGLAGATPAVEWTPDGYARLADLVLAVVHRPLEGMAYEWKVAHHDWQATAPADTLDDAKLGAEAFADRVTAGDAGPRFWRTVTRQRNAEVSKLKTELSAARREHNERFDKYFGEVTALAEVSRQRGVDLEAALLEIERLTTELAAQRHATGVFVPAAERDSLRITVTELRAQIEADAAERVRFTAACNAEAAGLTVEIEGLRVERDAARADTTRLTRELTDAEASRALVVARCDKAERDLAYVNGLNEATRDQIAAVIISEADRAEKAERERDDARALFGRESDACEQAVRERNEARVQLNDAATMLRNRTRERDEALARCGELADAHDVMRARIEKAVERLSGVDVPTSTSLYALAIREAIRVLSVSGVVGTVDGPGAPERKGTWSTVGGGSWGCPPPCERLHGSGIASCVDRDPVGRPGCRALRPDGPPPWEAVVTAAPPCATCKGTGKRT